MMMNNLVEDSEKRKAEILAESKKAKKDEGMENADYRGSRIGVIAYAIVAFFLLIFSIPDKMNIVNAIARFRLPGSLAEHSHTIVSLKRNLF